MIIYLILFIETYLYRVDIISSLANFYFIIYNTDEIYKTDKKRIKVKTHIIEMLPTPKPEIKTTVGGMTLESVATYKIITIRALFKTCRF